jgi:hypothetical protein
MKRLYGTTSSYSPSEAFAGITIIKGRPHPKADDPDADKGIGVRWRNDGLLQAVKELRHSPSQWVPHHEDKPMAWGNPLPYGQWITVKMVIRNEGSRVRIEAWRLDDGSGNWLLDYRWFDEGDWNNTVPESNTVYGGHNLAVYVRNNAGSRASTNRAYYRWMSIQPISSL